jgi:M6 family metalloprotease-like protein
MKKRFIVFLLILAVALSACGAKATPTVTQPPVPTEMPVSTDDGTVTVTIVNNTNATVNTFWVDNGMENQYATVDAGGSYDQSTYPNNLWRVRDASGSLLLEYTTTTDKQQTATIAQPVASANVAPCKLPAATGDLGSGFPINPLRMASTGTVKVPVLFTDFSDAPASKTPEQVLAILSPGAPEFYRAISYGRLDLQLVPYFKWLRVSQPSTAYDFSTYDGQLSYLKEAVALADPEVDFSGATSVYVIANPDATGMSFGPAFTGAPDWGGYTADGTTIYNGVTSGNDMTGWGFLWLNHEVDHTMGLPDLYASQFDTNNYDTQHRFVGDFDIMGFIGGKAPELLAYPRWQLGWLDDSQIACQTTPEATTTLSAIENPGGTKMVVVPTGATTAVVIESRRALGYDTKLVKPGALVYTVDTSVASGAGPINILPAVNSDPYRDQSPLGPGESLTVGKVTITVLSATADGDTVQVMVAP